MAILTPKTIRVYNNLASTVYWQVETLPWFRSARLHSVLYVPQHRMGRKEKEPNSDVLTTENLPGKETPEPLRRFFGCDAPVDVR